jgi:intein-encoded DNA endonuclease-like protein
MPIHRKYDKDFFKTWSSDMSYVLGFLYADGNIVRSKRGTHYVSWYTADESLLQAMRHILQAEHQIQLRNTTSGKVYRMQVGSKEWFADLSRLGLTPNKVKRLMLPRIPIPYQGDFIRGYFDGDGNVWVGEIHKNRKIPTPTIQVAFTSASFDFLVSLRGLLKERGLVGGGIYTNKERTYSRLSYSVRDALKIWKIMYNAEHKLLLKRKQQVFEKFFNCGGSSTG